MTHFNDLTSYSYGASDGSDAGALNVGWLSRGVEFPTASPDPKFVDRLWRFCKISIGQTRGLHECEICHSREGNVARMREEKLLLGSAEIRVISDRGQVYAAPNLIFHYVVSHNYSPPPEFVRAVLIGTCPPESAYYKRLSMLGRSWSDTLIPERSDKSFKFLKTSEGVVKVEE